MNNIMNNDPELDRDFREEKSKFEDMPVMLCLVIDEGKVIGAYLDYSGYTPSIAPIDFKDYLK